MGFQPPALEGFGKLAEILKTNYQKENLQRLAFIQIFEKCISSTRDIAVLMGACVLEMELIRKEYKGFSPKEVKGYFYTSGSSVYSTIESGLGITKKNDLHDDECLIYLFKFYEYIKNLPEETAFFAGSKQHLLNKIKDALKEIKKREENRIELLAQGVPKLLALQKNILALIPDYKKATATRWFPNFKRKLLLEFIELVNETCKLLYTENTITKKNEDHLPEFAYLHTCNVLLGMMLFALVKIEKEYKFLSPSRSELFKHCLQSINAKSLKSIDYEKKILWLKTLSRHIDNIHNQLDYRKKDLSKWQIEIDKFVVELETKKNKPSRIISYVSTATGYAAKYGISFAITQAARTYALPAMGGALVSGLTGPLGLVIYSAAGTMIMTQLGQLVKDNLMPSALAYVYAFILEKIGNVVANTTVGIATYTFTATKQGFQALLGHPALKSEDREFIIDWINTLLKLPNDIMPEKEKSQIRNVLGIENELDEYFVLINPDVTEGVRL